MAWALHNQFLPQQQSQQMHQEYLNKQQYILNGHLPNIPLSSNMNINTYDVKPYQMMSNEMYSANGNISSISNNNLLRNIECLDNNLHLPNHINSPKHVFSSHLAQHSHYNTINPKFDLKSVKRNIIDNSCVSDKSFKQTYGNESIHLSPNRSLKNFYQPLQSIQNINGNLSQDICAQNEIYDRINRHTNPGLASLGHPTNPNLNSPYKNVSLRMTNNNFAAGHQYPSSNYGPLGPDPNNINRHHHNHNLSTGAMMQFAPPQVFSNDIPQSVVMGGRGPVSYSPAKNSLNFGASRQNNYNNQSLKSVPGTNSSSSTSSRKLFYDPNMASVYGSTPNNNEYLFNENDSFQGVVAYSSPIRFVGDQGGLSLRNNHFNENVTDLNRFGSSVTQVPKACSTVVIESADGASNDSLCRIMMTLSAFTTCSQLIFNDLHSFASGLYNRAINLQTRVDKASVSLTLLERKTSLTNDVSTESTYGCLDVNLRDAATNIFGGKIMGDSSAETIDIIDQQLIRKDTMPSYLQIFYECADVPPPLYKLNKFREDGKDASKFYTDPEYFFNLWRNDMLQDGIPKNSIMDLGSQNRISLPASSGIYGSQLELFKDRHAATHLNQRELRPMPTTNDYVPGKMENDIRNLQLQKGYNYHHPLASRPSVLDVPIHANMNPLTYQVGNMITSPKHVSHGQSGELKTYFNHNNNSALQHFEQEEDYGSMPLSRYKPKYDVRLNDLVDEDPNSPLTQLNKLIDGLEATQKSLVVGGSTHLTQFSDETFRVRLEADVLEGDIDSRNDTTHNHVIYNALPYPNGFQRMNDGISYTPVAHSNPTPPPPPPPPPSSDFLATTPTPPPPPPPPLPPIGPDFKENHRENLPISINSEESKNNIRYVDSESCSSSSTHGNLSCLPSSNTDSLTATTFSLVNAESNSVNLIVSNKKISNASLNHATTTSKPDLTYKIRDNLLTAIRSGVQLKKTVVTQNGGIAKSGCNKNIPNQQLLLSERESLKENGLNGQLLFLDRKSSSISSTTTATGSFRSSSNNYNHDNNNNNPSSNHFPTQTFPTDVASILARRIAVEYTDTEDTTEEEGIDFVASSASSEHGDTRESAVVGVKHDLTKRHSSKRNGSILHDKRGDARNQSITNKKQFDADSSAEWE